jgi:hypothetical protein
MLGPQAIMDMGPGHMAKMEATKEDGEKMRERYHGQARIVT